MTSIPPSLVATCSPFHQQVEASDGEQGLWATDRKSTRLNSSHGYISYAVFCLKKKTRQSHPSLPDTGHHPVLLTPHILSVVHLLHDDPPTRSSPCTYYHC